MKKIKLGKRATKHKGLYALVDVEDFEELNQFSWHVYGDANLGYYAQRHSRKKDVTNGMIYMHRQIACAPKGIQVDHKNHNTPDNRKANLRLVTVSQNLQNQRCIKGGSSKYKGVTWHRQKKKWQAQIGINGKYTYLGLFTCELEAARAYDKAAQEHFGEHAFINFPEKEGTE